MLLHNGLLKTTAPLATYLARAFFDASTGAYIVSSRSRFNVTNVLIIFDLTSSRHILQSIYTSLLPPVDPSALLPCPFLL